MTELNAEQKLAVETKSRHCLVLAGAGTGKTTTIIARCAQLLRMGVNEKDMLIITFTRRAASEIRSRLNSQLKRKVQVYAGTFHSFAARIMHNNPKLFDFDSPSLIDREDAQYAFKQYRRQFPKKPEVKVSLLADAHSLSINTQLPIQQCLQKLEVDEVLTEYFQAASAYYEKFKRQRNYVDYDDILNRLASALQQKEIAEALGDRFKHILIDEMQDTNPLQWLIVDALIPHTSVYCVGDDAQSIYGFRGADFESIHGFTVRVPDGTILKLQENYRSTQEILDVSNWLLTQSELKYDKELTAKRGAGRKPLLVDCEDAYAQADVIVQHIFEAYQTENKWANNMILIRGGYQGRSIEARLIESEIPYVLIGGVGLLGAKHVKDLLTIPRIMANRFDEIAWLRFLELWPGVGERTAERIFESICGDQGLLKQSDNEMGLIESVESLAKDDQFGWSRALLYCLTGSANPSDAIENALKCLEQRLASNYSSDNWDARRKDFQYLSQLAEKHLTISSFVEEYLINPVYESEANRTADSDVVKLITIHSAKGLEAKRCFVPDLQPGTYPSLHCKDAAEIEEERRVLYVALTRAIDELVITRSMRGWATTGGLSENYFFMNVPESLFEYVGIQDDDGSDSSTKVKIRF